MVKQMVGFHEDKTWAQFSCSVFLWREKKKRERERTIKMYNTICKHQSHSLRNA